jgi:hypothetical protein
MRLAVIASLGLPLALAACNSPSLVRTPGGIVSNENLAVVVDGELRVGWYTATIQNDCTQTGELSVRPTLDPANGTLSQKKTTEFPNLRVPPGDKRLTCNERKFPGVLVNYKPNPGFVGTDKFGIDVIWPNGNSIRRNITVQIR